MFVVRKFDREFPLILRLRGLIRAIGFSEAKARIFAWPGAQVTDSANRWSIAGKSLAREKLLAMAAHAGIMIGKICDVRKISFRRPGGWDLVTGITRESFVLFR